MKYLTFPWLNAPLAGVLLLPGNEIQAFKEVTGTWKYSLSDKVDALIEYRRDWSNHPCFITNSPASPSAHQDTALLGLVWWHGGKQGSW
jgi:hypothetical protein